jgi:hypothetical protein
LSNVAHNRGGIHAPPGTPLGKRPMHMTQTTLLEGSPDEVVISDAPTHTHAKNITHTQQKGIVYEETFVPK